MVGKPDQTAYAIDLGVGSPVVLFWELILVNRLSNTAISHAPEVIFH